MIHEYAGDFDNRYRNAVPDAADRVICVRNGEVLYSDAGGAIRYPTFREVGEAGEYLFSLGGERYFSGGAEAFGEYVYHPARELRAGACTPAAFAGVTALHLENWYADNRFCGRCGKETRRSETERALVCGCGNIVYPRINPAVIVAVTSGGRICLTKYNRPNARWSLVAGYNEVGETIEQTVLREVKEEIGLRVKNLRYYTSQPWGLSGSLLFGFFCETDGDDALRADGVELKEARWFRPGEIDFPDDGFSLTRRMIEAFRKAEA
ncbi:MAG: NAD(+) diphosphatase [Clostridia bacterium]|nr:NAD(+) diphosphatase [Clostridia bacterium]